MKARNQNPSFLFIITAFITVVCLVSIKGSAGAAETCKIAFIDVQSGPAAKIGEQVKVVYDFCVDQQNKKGGILGKKIEPIIVDHEFKPQLGVRRTKQVILDKNADFIVVGTCSNVVIAMHPVISEYKKILLNLGALSDPLQGEYFSRYAFRAVWNNWAQTATYASYYAKQPYTKFYLLNPDYVYGHDFAKAVTESLERINPKAKIVGDEYYELGIKDWGPYLTKIKASGAEVIVTCARAMEVLTSIKQMKEFDFKIEIACSAANVPSVLEAAGNLATGIVHVGGVLNTDDAKGVRETEELWHEYYKNHPDKDYHYPNVMAMDQINGWKFFVAAIEKAGSFEADKIINAWEGMHFTSLHGKDSYMRACDHQMILPMSVAKIEEGPNKYLGDKPYLGKPIFYASGDAVAIPATAEYNQRCK